MTSLSIHPSRGRPSGPLRGIVNLPGDKSISHRAIIFSALSRGTVRIENLLEGEDVMRTVAIFKKLGVSIRKRGKVWVVKGRGPRRFRPYKGVLYCGNSGTTMRLMMGVLAALPFRSDLTGDASLNRRPMERVARPLRRMGARIEEIHRKGKRIIRIQGPVVRGIRYRLPVASAQLKSALLLAGLVAGVRVKLKEPGPSRDHTERMIHLFRKPVRRLVIPGDPSSAAFFVVAGLIHQGSEIRIRNILLNPTRTGYIDILLKMGGNLQIRKKGLISGEPVGDLIVKPGHLKGIRVGGSIVPRLIDEAPILAVAASRAQGRSVFSGMGELRVKESDRIVTICREFKKFGVKIQERRDGFAINGGQPIRGATASGVTAMSHGDHRIAMSLAILATVARGRSLIKDIACIRTSFPQFVSILKRLTS